MHSSSLIFPIFLQLLGVLVVIAEIIVPSGGMLAILSISVFGYSIFLVFNNFSTTAGFIFLGIDAVTLPFLIIIGLKMLAKSPLTLNKKLSSKEGILSQSPELQSYLGQEGIALSDLRPSGIARINGKRVDVVTRGEYLEKNTPIVVYSVTGNQVIVVELVQTTP